MKKLLMFLVFLFFAILSVYFYIEKEKTNNKPLPPALSETSEKNIGNKQIKHKLKERYALEKDKYIAELVVIRSSTKTFDGSLDIFYIEDLYKETRLIDSSWVVKGIHKEDNNWELELYENDYEKITLNAIVEDNKMIIKEMPVLDKGDVMLNFSFDFNYPEKKEAINSYYLTVQQRIKTNPYTNVKSDNLEGEMNKIQTQYPKNSDGKIESVAKATMFIHYEYLNELSKRINENFASSDKKLKEIETYIQTNSMKTDSRFEEKTRQMFEEITNLQEENEHLTSLFNDKASFYAFPQKEESDIFSTNDAQTLNLINTIVTEFSLSKVSTFNDKTEKLIESINKQYSIFSAKLEG